MVPCAFLCRLLYISIIDKNGKLSLKTIDTQREKLYKQCDRSLED